MPKKFSDANFPRDGEGRTLHVGCRPGDVANRVISVGSAGRAKVIASLFDKDYPTMHYASSRGYTTYTGHYNGVPISVIATGMGLAMMDFLIREIRESVQGKLAVVRLGTCGSIDDQKGPIGNFSIASQGSVSITHKPDGLRKGSRDTSPYHISKVVKPDVLLSDHVVKAFKSVAPQLITECMNASGATFYGDQGRQCSSFEDKNSTLLKNLKTLHPGLVTLEMETFHLMHLADLASNMAAIGTHIIIADRSGNGFIEEELLRQRELQGGRVLLDALSSYHIPESELDQRPQCVWKQRSKL